MNEQMYVDLLINANDKIKIILCKRDVYLNVKPLSMND